MTSRQIPRNLRRVLGVATAALIVGALAFVKISMHAELERLQEGNRYLKNEIRKLEVVTTEVRDFKDKIAVFLARKQIMEAIDGWAVPAAEAIAALSRLPANVRLTGLTIDDDRMSVFGEADSEGAAASAPRAWSASPVVHEARLAAYGPGAAAGAPALDKRMFRMEAKIAFSPPTSAGDTPRRGKP